MNLSNIVEKIQSQPEMWNTFTKKEEYNPPFIDKYGRFQYYLSNQRNIREPNVSKYLLENGFRPEYPDEKGFAVCLTHDIDRTHQNLLECANESIRSAVKGNLKYVLKYPSYIIDKKKHPYWNFKKIIDIEDKYNAKSSFFFLAHKPDNWDYRYNIEEVSEEINYIIEKGWEVGLHGSREAHNNLNIIKEEKKRLEKVVGEEVIGYRNHYLCFKTPDTWELLSQAGFKYDTTFGYADCAGFRNGMCHPFKPFNLNTGKEIDILEIPLTIMDGTLLGPYMRLDFESAWLFVKDLIDKVEKYHGVITILWHNTYMQNEYLEFYERILNYCHSHNAWITSGKEIVDHMH